MKQQSLTSVAYIFFIFCLFLIYPGLGQTEMPIKAYQALYQLYWNGLSVGLSKHIVKELAPNHFWAQSHSYPKFSFLPFEDFEQGEFIYHQEEYRPIHYTFLSRSNQKRLEGTLTFDWENLKVTKDWTEKSQEGKASEEASIPLNAKDKISFFFQLREALRAGKKEFQYTIIEPKKVSHWQMVILNEEKLTTPIGTFDTIKLENKMDHNDRVTHFWVAKDMDFILVKLVQYQKGKKKAEVIIKDFSQGTSESH